MALNVLNQCSSNIEYIKQNTDDKNIKTNSSLFMKNLNTNDEISPQNFKQEEINYEKYHDRRPCIKIEISRT